MKDLTQTTLAIIPLNGRIFSQFFRNYSPLFLTRPSINRLLNAGRGNELRVPMTNHLGVTHTFTLPLPSRPPPPIHPHLPVPTSATRVWAVDDSRRLKGAYCFSHVGGNTRRENCVIAASAFWVHPRASLK